MKDWVNRVLCKNRYNYIDALFLSPAIIAIAHHENLIAIVIIVVGAITSVTIERLTKP